MAGVLALGVAIIVARFWWATLTPSVPKHWPPGSVWIQAPPAPLDWSPRGQFVGCWLDNRTNTDKCEFANYRGKISRVGKYTTCDDRAPLPDSQLGIRAADYTKGTFDESTVDGVKLQDGTVLIPVSACNARRNSAPVDLRQRYLDREKIYAYNYITRRMTLTPTALLGVRSYPEATSESLLFTIKAKNYLRHPITVRVLGCKFKHESDAANLLFTSDISLWKNDCK